jgi:formylglycine-generating enzyme required for sulfatase activity
MKRHRPDHSRATTAPAVILLALVACADQPSGQDPTTPIAERTCGVPDEAPVALAGGTFAMGQDDVYPAEEGPVRATTVGRFWIDPHEVTNRQFAEFVEATGYVTLAEKPVDPALFAVPEDQIPREMLQPGSAVFVAPERPSSRYADWWKYLPGANWKKPYGPEGPGFEPEEPVVHLAYQDMLAYAQWRGGRLPTEAEWEFAARAGQGNYTEQPSEANSWQGVFPAFNDESDGYRDIAPVGCYEPNAFGLYDMIGNVWEMTSDFYRPGHDPEDSDNPRGPGENAAYDPLNPDFPSRVTKGGSYLCAPNYCRRYRPAARIGRDPALGASNVGFRLVYDEAPANSPG